MTLPGALGPGREVPDLRLAPAAVAAFVCCSLVLGGVAPLGVALFPATAALGATIALRTARARRGPPHLREAGLRLALAAAVGAASLLVALAHREAGAADLDSLAEAGRRVTVTGTAGSPTEVASPWGDDRVLLDLTARTLEARGNVRETAAEITIATTRAAAPAPGAQVTVTGTLADTPGGPILEAVLIGPLDPAETGPPAPRVRVSELGAGTARIRGAFSDARRGLDADAGALVGGMAVGDTTGLSDAVDEAMKTSGLTHLVAVSGTNTTLVLVTVLLVLQLLGMPRLVRAVAGAAVLAGYLLLVGPDPSVLRAGTMAMLLLVAQTSGRGGSALPAAFTAVILLSWTVPSLTASYGLALSAAAVIALLTLARPLTGALVRATGGRLSPPLAGMLVVPLIAQTACTPILLLFTETVSLWAVAANLTVAPLTVPITLLGMASAVTSLPAPGLASLLSAVAGIPAAAVVALAQFWSSLPAARIPFLTGPLGALVWCALVALTSALIVVAWRRRRDLRTARAGARAQVARLLGQGVAAEGTHPGHRIVRFRGALVALVLVATAVVPVVGVLRTGPIADHGTARVVVCDVGQGQAVLLRSAGTTVLVDTGPDPQDLARCLDQQGDPRLDLVILTHPHADHVNGTPALAGREVGAVLGCPAPAEDWKPAARLGGQVPQPLTTGVLDLADPDLRLEVIWPGSVEDVHRAAAQEDSSRDSALANDCSVALRATWPADGLSAVLLGDLEPAAQKELTDRLPEPPTTGFQVVVIAHHGSPRQHDPLYARLGTDLGIASAGDDNDYGHPSPDTMEALRALGARTARTDLDGSLEVRSDGITIFLLEER